MHSGSFGLVVHRGIIGDASCSFGQVVTATRSRAKVAGSNPGVHIFGVSGLPICAVDSVGTARGALIHRDTGDLFRRPSPLYVI